MVSIRQMSEEAWKRLLGYHTRVTSSQYHDRFTEKTINFFRLFFQIYGYHIKDAKMPYGTKKTTANTSK